MTPIRSLVRKVAALARRMEVMLAPPMGGLDRLALVAGRHDRCSPEERQYHADAERGMDWQWDHLVWPVIHDLDFRVVVDLAAGFGRNSARLLEHAGELTIVDINQECIEVCKRRFGARENVRFVKNDGVALDAIPSASTTLVYCFDAMVHFDSDIVRSYLREFGRILMHRGCCFCHHSNCMARPGGGLTLPHNRNFMSRELFAHYAGKERFDVVRQRVIDWGDYPQLDCLSVIRKP